MSPCLLSFAEPSRSILTFSPAFKTGTITIGRSLKGCFDSQSHYCSVEHLSAIPVRNTWDLPTSIPCLLSLGLRLAGAKVKLRHSVEFDGSRRHAHVRGTQFRGLLFQGPTSKSHWPSDQDLYAECAVIGLFAFAETLPMIRQNSRLADQGVSRTPLS
jgi:hypothetical protein